METKNENRFIIVNIDKHQQDVWFVNDYTPFLQDADAFLTLIIDTQEKRAYLGGSWRECGSKTYECGHGITFNWHECRESGMTPAEVQKKWPRLEGPCPLGCGYCGIYYASEEHLLAGDW